VLIVTDDGAGIIRRSLQAWSDNRGLFGTCAEAWVCARSDGAVLDGRLCRVTDFPSAPTMVLIDDRGHELWLSGALCGYSGEGPAGTEKILRTNAVRSGCW
jgi:hypothetical protein